MIVDAKLLSTELAIYNMIRTRGNSKTSTRTAVLLAYLESLKTGMPVEIDIGFKLVNIEDIH